MAPDKDLARAQALALDEDIEMSKWTDWKWHIRNSVRDIDTFERLLGVDLSEYRSQFDETVKTFPMSITPYYLSLMERDDLYNDPIFRQAFPSPHELELSNEDLEDPLSEDVDSSVPGITHRYPDRVLYTVANTCSMYCRHCTRKRKVGDQDYLPSQEQLDLGLEYIREHPEIRDVLLSGGDPFMLSDEALDSILAQLDDIPHVEVVRIGSRMPVVLPYRVTKGLAEALSGHKKALWLNTHFNHPREITPSSRRALATLADAGIPLGNQSVLLAGVNDCPRIMRTLVQKLVANRVRPYYLYQCDLSQGLSHFRTPVSKGIEIIENLIGHTSGFAVPTYVIDAPGGGGKIPVMPNYVLSWSPTKVILRNYEGVITTYRQPSDYKSDFCTGDCQGCDLQLKLEDAEEYNCVGIANLLGEHDPAISLVPEGTERMERRKDA